MKIYIEEIDRRGRFRARRDSPDGPIIVMSSRQPLLNAARILRAEGATGKLEMWDAVRPYARMSGDIEKLAGLDNRGNGSKRIAGPPLEAVQNCGGGPASGRGGRGSMNDPREPDEAEARRERAGGFNCQYCGEENDSPICWRCAEILEEEGGDPDS